jgi:protein involved in polysaccharide export with SLBB domain
VRKTSEGSRNTSDCPLRSAILDRAVAGASESGTPSGVGPINPGDAVDITIEGIGTLHNPVIAEPLLVV